VFNCAAAAATTSGCTQTVYYAGTTHQYYYVTVWYPFTNSTVNAEGWNAKVELHLSCYGAPCHVAPYAVGIALNSTAFIIGFPYNSPPQSTDTLPP
jgi:hypothetical protein